MERPGRAGSVAVALLGLLGLLSTLGWPGAEELSWGFRYPSLLPLTLRLVCALALGLALIPRTSHLARSRLSALLDRGAGRRARTFVILALAGALTAFLLLQTRRLYGDSEATLALLEAGQLINWKEPLDRFFTAVVYRVGSALLGWSAMTAVAAVSTLAGLVWVGAALGLARDVGSEAGDRAIVAGLLLTPGLMQLFFGNVENYSLLAAGTLVYLWTGVRFLQGKTSLFVPSVALGTTVWIHLAAAWLLPTLAYLFLSRLATDWASGVPDWSTRGFRRLLGAGAGLLVPTVFTLGLGIVLPSEGGLNFATFGGGDHSMFVPLTSPSGPFEKFTLFGPDHLIAMLNEWILVAGAAAAVVVAYLALTPSSLRRWTPPIRFVGLATALFLVFSFVFNPDMAVVDVGVRNEWDLLSPPGVGLAALAALLLLEWEPSSDARGYVGLVAVSTSLVLMGSWVLYNARVFG
jgi:hypothetical protein